ncbi:hypothetical protein GC425_03400 [Corynebacterium sp. zg254]|uniref:Bacteriocin biosynthesis cyclodehydratase domain-containing protein n=1 Tax=Corynebacterium zhongnanshanii TaxID=2768834 RepID=A0ABQ6VF01_9CORY|nr:MULTISPECIES: hypothetical protein [Corynebacterium]KAB3523001.1 hypothetical protein F8377_02220 [Corynebacterium zhongnanshanii]MCR5913914.1 hypothetical protein [Corynebacterium sp. zg254]
MPASVTMLLRPRTGIQFGVLPQHAVILPLPQDVTLGQVAQVFGLARQPISAEDLVKGLGHCGLQQGFAEEVIKELLQARVLLAHSRRYTPTYVLENGASSKHTVQALDRMGIPHRLIEDPSIAGNSLVLTGGEIFVPNDIHYALMTHRIAHFPHGLVDGKLVMGPLIIPGVTPCLTCFDSLYTAGDAQWNAMRVQASAKPAHRDRYDLDFAALAIATLVRDELAPWAMQHRAAWNNGTPEDAPAVPRSVTHRRVITIGSFDVHEETTVDTYQPACPVCSIARMDGAVRRVRHAS